MRLSYLHRQKIMTILAIVVFLMVGITGVLILVSETAGPFTYNQFIVQKLELQYGNGDGEILPDYVHSSLSNGLQAIIGNPIRTPPAFDDSNAFFDYVYSWIPPYAVVYPTEGFYYYYTTLPDKGEVWGNMRVADLDKGILSIAYFTVPGKETHYLKLTQKDGVHIDRISNYAYDVTYHGKTIHFKLPLTDFSPPQKISLLPMEEFVGHIHDESDTKFFLVYNHETDSFYEILDDETGVSDQFLRLNETMKVGMRTNFVYYDDAPTHRTYLLGVYLPNVEANNFFDGPGDQVPFRVSFLSKLHRAYPNTMLGDGVDEHGVYLNLDEWVRIAVSPYFRYQYFDELYERITNCYSIVRDGDRATCLTKEWWNNTAWREGIYQQLADEGKLVQPINVSPGFMVTIHDDSNGTADQNADENTGIASP